MSNFASLDQFVNDVKALLQSKWNVSNFDF